MKRQKKKRLILRIFRNLICIGLFVILAALLGNAWVIGSTKSLIKNESEVNLQKQTVSLYLEQAYTRTIHRRLCYGTVWRRHADFMKKEQHPRSL